MFESLLEMLAENAILAYVIIFISAVLVFFVIIKPIVLAIVKKTKTKKDDKIAEAMYGAIEEHKEQVEAIHRVAKKAREKKCQKQS